MTFHRSRATPAKGSLAPQSKSRRLAVSFDAPTLNRVIYLATTQQMPTSHIVRVAVRRYFETLGSMGEPPKGWIK